MFENDDALTSRLGVDVPKGWWPTAPMLKGMEAAGFGWVQVRTPPRAMLCDRERLLRHAGALRRAVDTSGLKIVLHGPDDLSAGDPAHDRALDGLIDYAAATGARYVVYHGANFASPTSGGDAAANGANSASPTSGGDAAGNGALRGDAAGNGALRGDAAGNGALRGDAAAADAVRERAEREEESLRARVPRLERVGVTLAIENLAPVHPGPPRLCHDPEHVRDLVLRLASPRVGMLFDAGHANIVAGLRRTDVRSLLEPVLDSVVLFHLHDNLGARGDRGTVPGLDPLRLDLHLAPGAGRLSWGIVAPLMLSRPVPLVLEVHPPHRPEPLRLASVTAELLSGDRPVVGGARAAVTRGRARAGLAVPPG